MQERAYILSTTKLSKTRGEETLMQLPNGK